MLHLGLPAGTSGTEPPANTGDIKDTGSILGLGKNPEGGHGNPLQYSCIKHPMDKGAWQATVHRATKSQTWLKQFSTCCSKPIPGISRQNYNFKRYIHFYVCSKTTIYHIAKSWEQPICPLTDEWMKKIWDIWYTHTHTYTHIHRVDYYSAIKRNETMLFAAT